MLKKTLTTIFGVSCALSLNLQAAQEEETQAPEESCCEQFWLDAEYIYWKIQNSPSIIPLVIEGPVDSPHTLGTPGFGVVLGGKSLHNDWRSGGRFGLGWWFTKTQTIGAESNYFFLVKDSNKQSVSSNGEVGSPFLAVPYFNVVTGEEASSDLSDPGFFSAVATLKNSNTMQGADFNFLTRIVSSCSVNFDVLLGFRYWNFFDRVTFDTNSPDLPSVHSGEVFKTNDTFQANNNFYGGQIGAKLDYMYHNFFLDLKGKIALGAMCEAVKIHGYLLTNDFTGFTGTPTRYPGGYSAMPTNIGTHGQTRFAVIPEINFNIGYEFAHCFRVQVGYTAIYASNVLWAGKQMNRNINPSQSAVLEYTGTPALVGQASPQAQMRTDGLWVQGVSAGFTLKF